MADIEERDKPKEESNQTNNKAGDVDYDDDDYLSGQPKFGRNVIEAFVPFRILLTLFGRWPLIHHRNPDGTYTYQLHWHHPIGIYFLIVTVYFIYLLIAGGYIFGTIIMFLTSSGSEVTVLTTNLSREHKTQFREGILVQRHMIFLISLWINVFLAVITSINVIWKQTYMINYFSFWTRAVQTMHMDVARGTRINSWIYVGMFCIVIFCLTLMAIFRLGASSTGGPVLMAILTFKLYDPYILTKTGLDTTEYNVSDTMSFTLYSIFGGIGFLYVFVGSKLYLLVFLFKCKLLRNAFALWNGRIYAAILRGGSFTQTKEGRTTFTLLFKDHCVLLDLLESTNRFFAGVLESYFLLQASALCFECYITLRTARFGHNYQEAQDMGYFIREYDFIPSALIFVLNFTILYLVVKSAALVGEEAIAGLEVIRRKTMLGRKTDEELYFMLSMYTSYISYRKLEISSGGYFYINKEFVITIVSTIFSYFIILFQFQPYLDPKVRQFDFAYEREVIGKFLVYLENGIDCSWFAKDKLHAMVLCSNYTGATHPTTTRPLVNITTILPGNFSKTMAANNG